MVVHSRGANIRTWMLQVEKKMPAAGEALLSAEAEKRAAVARDDYAMPPVLYVYSGKYICMIRIFRAKYMFVRSRGANVRK